MWLPAVGRAVPPTTTATRPTVESSDDARQPGDAAVRVLYNALRTLVPDSGVVTLSDLTSVTRLDPGEAAAATNRLARTGPLSVSRYATGGEPAWHVRRTDR